MKAGELKKGYKFKVVGWEADCVLTVHTPMQVPKNGSIRFCVPHGKSIAQNGYAILAGEGEEVDGGLFETMYAIPIGAEVVIVN